MRASSWGVRLAKASAPLCNLKPACRKPGAMRLVAQDCAAFRQFHGLRAGHACRDPGNADQSPERNRSRQLHPAIECNHQAQGKITGASACAINAGVKKCAVELRFVFPKCLVANTAGLNFPKLYVMIRNRLQGACNQRTLPVMQVITQKRRLLSVFGAIFLRVENPLLLDGNRILSGSED